MLILWCFILTCSIVYVYDYVSFPRNFLARIYSVIFKKEIRLDRIKLPKLLECSLCASTWSTLVVLLVVNYKLAPMCLVFGWLTKYILDVFNIINMSLNKLIDWIYDKINR